MASASTATQNVLGQVAAGGDSLRQSSWNSLVYSGLRAAINLMPDSFQYHPGMNLSNKDDLQEICSFAAAFFGNCQTQGNLKWNYMDAVIKVLQNSNDLDRYLPDTSQRQQYTASDSVLTLFNAASGPGRPWETMWEEGRQIRSKHISKSHFAVKDCALISDIHAGLQTILSQNDAAGGDPIAFADHISFLSMMNEKRGDAADSFRRVRDALEAFAPGTVIIQRASPIR